MRFRTGFPGAQISHRMGGKRFGSLDIPLCASPTHFNQHGDLVNIRRLAHTLAHTHILLTPNRIYVYIYVYLYIIIYIYILKYFEKMYIDVNINIYMFKF